MKTIRIFGFCLLVLLLAGSALADSTSLSLINTTWAGDLTILNPDGSTTTITGASLTFTTEQGRNLSGTLSGFAGGPVVFAALREGRGLRMTAVNQQFVAEIERGHGPHGGEPAATTSLTMEIRGSNFADGTMLIGTLAEAH